VSKVSTADLWAVFRQLRLAGQRGDRITGSESPEPLPAGIAAVARGATLRHDLVNVPTGFAFNPSAS
jgi:hypothetical protein